MEQNIGAPLSKEQNENLLRKQYGNPQKNNQQASPQASDNSADAGGQADLEALKARVASMTSSPDATGKNEPENPSQHEPKADATPKLYAGKFKDEGSLEKGYQELEKKLGQKSDLERIGERLMQYSGRDAVQLNQDLEAAIAAQAPSQSTSSEQESVQKPDPRIEQMEKKLKAIELANLAAQLEREKSSLFAKHPEAKKYETVLEDLWKNVDIKKSFEQIYSDRFLPTEQANTSKQVEESKDTFQAESSVGKPTGSVDVLDTSKLSVDQLRQILPKKG